MKTERICRGIESHGLMILGHSGIRGKGGEARCQKLTACVKGTEGEVACGVDSLSNGTENETGEGKRFEVYGGDGLAEMERRETGGEEWHETRNREMVAAEVESVTAGKGKRKGRGRKRRTHAADASSEELLEGI